MSEVGTCLLQCYNKGCGQRFDQRSNKSDSCCFHPGEPFFHDAYKGWSCCKKKSVDFTEFLNIKGCSYSFHNSEKPPEPEKPDINLENDKADKLMEDQNTKIVHKSLNRPSPDAPMTKLPTTIAKSLLDYLNALDLNNETNSCVQEEGEVNVKVQPGTSCKNKGCKAIYQSDESNGGSCVHHPGMPIFHEGLKYWSCCVKRTTDFDVFLNQEGCSIGKHLWLKPKEMTNGFQSVVSCRRDWLQTGNQVCVAYYAKNAKPEACSFELNPVRLRVSIQFQDGLFEEDIELTGIVNVEQSSVTLAASKVEIKLRKADIHRWVKLAKRSYCESSEQKGANEADGNVGKEGGDLGLIANSGLTDLPDLDDL